MNKSDIDRYLQKSGDEKIINCNLIENEHGFATFTVSGDVLIIYNEYGDGKYWEWFFVGMAQKHGLKKIRWATRRNPKPFIRRYQAKIVGFVLEREV